MFHDCLYFVVSKKTPVLLYIQAKPKMLGVSKRDKYLKFIHQSLKLFILEESVGEAPGAKEREAGFVHEYRNLCLSCP